MHPHNKNAIDPCQFDGKSIHLDDDGEKKSLKMEIIRVCRNGKAFADTNQWASFKGDGSNFLIIGCDASYFTGGSTNGTTLHAVFVEDYDVESGTFDCINSWGPEHSAKPFPRIRDTDESIKTFHAFCIHLVDDKEDDKNSRMKVEVHRNDTGTLVGHLHAAMSWISGLLGAISWISGAFRFYRRSTDAVPAQPTKGVSPQNIARIANAVQCHN